MFLSITDIQSNLASAVDVSAVTDVNVDTSITISQSDLIFWKLTFDLLPEQRQAIHMYIYGSNSMCTLQNVALTVYRVIPQPDPECGYNEAFELCEFVGYRATEHRTGFCQFTCNCDVTSCRSMAVSIMPTSGASDLQLIDVSWQPQADLHYN